MASGPAGPSGHLVVSVVVAVNRFETASVIVRVLLTGDVAVTGTTGIGELATTHSVMVGFIKY